MIGEAYRPNPTAGNPLGLTNEELGIEATPTAFDMLGQAAQHMKDRAKTYDQPNGERSMGATIAAFNAVTGRDLRESEGWLLLALLKMVRGEQRAKPHQDSAEDLVAFSSLYGEARLGGR